MKENDRSIEFVGILPAAGIASRLSPSRYLKELLPVTYLVDDETGTARPMPVIYLSLRGLKNAGIQRCMVVISDRKPELMRFLGDGCELQLQLGYVQQTVPSGLTVAVDLAYPWIRGCHSCLMLPDTIVQPTNAMSRLRQVMDEEAPDLVLGVFPTSTPEQLGPVRFDALGNVLEVFDKPALTDLRNTWAMAIWSPAFSELLHDSVMMQGGATRPLGEIFNAAVQAGMRVRAVWYPEGSFIDIGTVKGLAQMLEYSKSWEFVRGHSLAAAGQ